MPHSLPIQLNYSHLRYFWAVAHAGNLTRAARDLHVAQSSISVQIQKLEQDLGTALFERRGKQLVLTEAGHITLDHADAIFAMGDELVGTLTQSTRRERQVLRVGALATLSRNFQIGFCAPMISRSDVEVIIRSGTLADLLAQLDAHRLDLVLVNHAPARDAATTWVAHAIDEQPVSLIAHRHWHCEEDSDGVAAILREAPLVVPTRESSIRSGFDALCERLSVRPVLAAEVDDMAMLRLVARAHAGVTVAPPIVLRDELDSGELIELCDLPELTETFVAITPERRYPNPLVRELLDAARS